MNLYYDSEFTGLHQASTLISMAFIADDGREFYAEFSDYNLEQCDDWIQKNVLEHTHWLRAPGARRGSWTEGELTCSHGNSEHNRQALTAWLAPYGQIEVWADCPTWDWVLLCQLYGGALQIPKQIFYIPFDLATLLKLKGLSPDMDRQAFAQLPVTATNQGQRHNALYDARLIRACYHRLVMGSKME